MNTMHCAKVVLQGTTYGFDIEYTYKYPDFLLGTLQKGMRVLVPFGRGNSKRIGLVTRVYDKEIPDERIKPIISVVDREPLLNDELMGLVRWLKEHTFCTYFEAFRTIIPSGYSVIHSSDYMLANSKPDCKMTDEEEALYKMLLLCNDKKEFDAVLDDSTGKGKSKVIESLVEKGVLERLERFKRRVGDETVRMIHLSSGFQSGEIDAKLTPKQKLVVDFLEENESVSIKEACYFLSVTQTIIQNMLKKGIIEEYSYETFRTPKFAEREKISPDDIVLSYEQNEAFCGIMKLIDAGRPAGALLHGVTGSGKTAVFMKLIDACVKRGKDAMLLVPEISLTPQLVGKFKAMFGDIVAVIHSSLSLGQRLDEYKRIKNGLAKIVIGTRSAVFAPLSDIGIIIMDEEGESSYKSEASPRYHARNVAIHRCGIHGSVLLMASATPSLESYYFARSGRYSLFELNNRYGNTKLPQVVVADMSLEAEMGNKSVFCEDLVRSVSECIKNGKQAILLLNRRGYNTHIACRGCKKTVSCPNCAIPLTYHKSNDKLMCHYCGYSARFSGKCPDCGSNEVVATGLGTQLLAEELETAFSGARILRMDADTTYSRCAYEEKFKAFENGEYDIMVGTQMIAKGLDFPNVTVVGVISLDNSLFAGDYKSFERTFSLLTQVVGRGGRGDSEAVAYIQTNVPDHHIISLASEQDYKQFYAGEIALRKQLIYPPFCDICAVYFTSGVETDAIRCANAFLDLMRNKLSELDDKFPLRVLGPAKSGQGRINNRYKYALTLKCRMSPKFRSFISELLLEAFKDKRFANVRVYADINGELA